MKPVKAMAVAKPTVQMTSAKTTGAPVVTRDPRIRPSADPRVSRNVSASPQQTAVVLPTPSPKPTTDIASIVPDSSGSSQSLAKVIPNSAGNIFDRLQDLTVKSEAGSPAKAMSPAKETKQSSNSTGVGETKGTNGQKASPDSKPVKKPSASPTKKDVNKASQTSTKVPSLEKKTNKEMNRKSDSRSPRKSGSPRSKSPSEDQTSRDPYVRQRRPSKSIRNRSPGSSNAPPVKCPKRSDLIPRGSNFKQGPMNRRQRLNSAREGGFSARPRQQGNERHHENSRKRSLHPDPVLTSPTDAKKARRTPETDVQGTNQLSDDLM